MGTPVPNASLPSFINKPEEYGLYNPSEDHIDLLWGGKSMRIPGCRDISRDPCHFDGVEGPPVPGTLIIRDSYTSGLDGQMPMPGSAYNWKAADAIRLMLGIDVKTRLAHSTKYKRGITFIPPVIDQDTYEAVKADAEARFATHKIAWAEAEVRAYEEALDRCKRAGVSAPPPDSGYNRAVIILSQHRNRISGQVAHADSVIEDSEAATVAAMKAIAMEMAEEAAKGKEIDKKKLAEQLLDDPEVRQHLSKKAKYRIRKVGHMPEKVKQE